MSLDGIAVLSPVFMLHKRNLGGERKGRRKDRERERREGKRRHRERERWGGSLFVL